MRAYIRVYLYHDFALVAKSWQIVMSIYSTLRGKLTQGGDLMKIIVLQLFIDVFIYIRDISFYDMP